jgi:hypothetical protein
VKGIPISIHRKEKNITPTDVSTGMTNFLSIMRVKKNPSLNYTTYAHRSAVWTRKTH